MQTDHKYNENVQRAKLGIFFSFTFSTNIVANFLKLGTADSFVVASLRLFKVDYIPDRSEVLLKRDYVSFHTNWNRDKTDVSFDILVLEVEGMLPNINADDGLMS